MSTAKKPYVIRGFNVNEPDRSATNPDTDGLDSIGVMDSFDSFFEKTVEKQHEVIVEMTTNSTFRTLSARNMVALNPGEFPHKADDTKELTVIDLVIVTNAQDHNDVRSTRSSVRDCLKTWAEKSRVKGRRGWRLNAIKTPTYEFDKKLGGVVIRTQVILSNLVVYSDDLCTINVSHDYEMEQEDLKNLTKFLERTLAGYYSRLCYRHSVIGEGEVI